MDKETLQKKIESGDTAWVIKLGSCQVLELKLSSEYKINDYGDLVHLIQDFDGYNSCIRTYKEIYHAYDTKEEAEWELEFGNVIRVEKLELPTWKDTETEQFYVFGWWHGNCELAMRRFDANDNCEYLIVEHESDKYEENLYGKKVKIVFKKPYNYENYLEACRICKKLFLGEEL